MPKGFFVLFWVNYVCEVFPVFCLDLFLCGFTKFSERSPVSFSLIFLGFVVQALLFVYNFFFMSLLIQWSEYRLEEYLKGMNWFMISWMLCLKRSQSGSGESVSGAWFCILFPRSWSS